MPGGAVAETTKHLPSQSAEADGEADRWGQPRQLWMLLGVTVGINFACYGFRAFLAPHIAEQFYAGLGPAAAQRQADLLTSGHGIH